MIPLLKEIDQTNLTKYQKKELTAEEAIERFVHPGDRIFIHSGCAEPLDLTQTLINMGARLPDVDILHFVNLSHQDYYKTAGEGHFRHNTFFIGDNLREAVKKGMADYTPMLLSNIPRLFKRGLMHLKTALIQITPPDKYGFCCYGTNIDISKPIAESAENIVAEINPNMPRTLGDSFIHMDKINAYVKTNHNIIEFTYDPPSEAAKKIAKFVASLIEDESTLQMGIGTIPNALTEELLGKKNLGIHSEVLSDGIVDLVEKGVVTCEKKTLHPGKIICSFIMGTRKLYDFVDNNPMLEFHSSDYCNDPSIISKNAKQVAVNAALTVDLTGQVNADSLGAIFYSGIGGQVDFVRGANLAEDGKPITVLPSTATLSNGKVVSRIVPYLDPGSGVVITRGDVHYVVTEWGIANLFGKSIRERVLQMIGIAHPDFREELLEYAKKWNYVYSDQKLPKSIDGRISIYPSKYEFKITLKNGKTVEIRPVKPTDERMLQELHYSLDKEDRYYRFFRPVLKFSHEVIQPICNIDYSTDMILVGIFSKENEKKIIAMGGFFKTEKPAIAELAFIVHKQWRGNGISKIFISELVKIARELNYKSFSGNILLENRGMNHIINTLGYPMTYRKMEAGVLEFIMDISK